MNTDGFTRIESRHGEVSGRGTCSSCGAAIIWVKTAAGNTMPVDPETDESHFATCPNASQHRKRRPVDAPADSHGCPVDGCEKRMPQQVLMCKPHWFAVPLHLRRAVTSAWQRVQRTGGDWMEPGYQRARQAAIDAVNQRSVRQ